jgi:hypothetical protein
MAGAACNNAFAEYYTGRTKSPPRKMLDVIFRGCIDKVNLDAMEGYYDKFFYEECDGTRYDCTECNHCASYARRVFSINKKLRRKIPADHHRKYYLQLSNLTQSMLLSLDE